MAYDFIAQGMILVATGVECPVPGGEAGMCIFDWEGKTAFWQAGCVYVRPPGMRGVGLEIQAAIDKIGNGGVKIAKD